MPVQADTGLLDLQEALRVAVTTHPSVMAKRSELTAAAHGLDASQWQRFPALSLQSSAPDSGRNNAVLTARIEQPLWAGGRITAGIDAATARVLVSESSLIDAEQAILVRTASAFAEVIRLQARIAAAEENLQEHQRLLELIKRRAASEVSPQNEVVVARARLEQARSEMVQFQTLLTNARADLQQLVGRGISRLAVPRLDLAAGEDLARSVQAAVEFSPVLRRLAAETLVAESEIRVSQSVLWPQISARHERIVGGSGATNNTTSTNTTSNYIALTYQLGGGLSAVSNIRQAEERRNAAELSRDTQKKDVEDKLRTDWNQERSAVAEKQIFTELVASTREVYESFVRQFAAGRKTWLEVLNARREATQARYSLADAEWNGFLAGKRIEIATGRIAAERAAPGASQ